MGIIAGLGRGMPSRPAGGRGGRWSSPGAAGRGAGRVPMPCEGANGLLPGRGAPGRAGRGPGLKRGASSASGASASAGVASAAGASGSSTTGSAAGSTRGPGFGAALAAGASSTISGAASTGAGSPEETSGLSAPFESAAGAAFLAGAFLAAFFAAAASFLAVSSAPYLSWNRFTTGGSTLDDGAFTYSPRSVSIVMTSALLTPYSLASSETRTLATLVVPPGPGPRGVRTASGCSCSSRCTHCNGSHRRLMSSCSRSSWVRSGGCLGRSARDAVSAGRGPMPPGPRHHAAGRGRRHVCARRVRDIQPWDEGAPRGLVRCRSGRVRRTSGPPRPPLRRPAATHAWCLVAGSRCTCGRVRGCWSSCRVVKTPSSTLAGRSAQG